MGKDAYKDSYNKRETEKDYGEDIFINYCQSKDNLEVTNFGFKSKMGIPNYWKVHPMVRNTPDFAVYRMGDNGKCTSMFLCNVKGTCRIKAEELFYYKHWGSYMGDIPVYMVFCFDDYGVQTLYFKTIAEVEKAVAEAGHLMHYQDGQVLKLVYEIKINGACVKCINGVWTESKS